MIPCTRIKIDKSFVEGIETNDKDKAIINAVISLGKNLGTNILAEGVETELQRAFLEEAGCVTQQGYLHHMPQDANETVEFLTSYIGSRVN